MDLSPNSEGSSLALYESGWLWVSQCLGDQVITGGVEECIGIELSCSPGKNVEDA